MMAYTGRRRPNGVPFLCFMYMKGLGILLDEVHKRVGKFVTWVCERAQSGLTDTFYGFIKSRKRSISVIDSYLNDSAFTAVKRDIKF